MQIILPYKNSFVDDDMQNKISDFVEKLQVQTHLPLWTLHNEMVIYALAVNSKPAWGIKTKLFNFMMIVSNKIMLSDMLIFCFGLLRVISLLKTVIGKKIKEVNKNNINKFTRIFFSFKVSSENYLYSDYIKQSESFVLKINPVSLEGMQYLDQPNFKFIIALLFKYAFGFTAKLKVLGSELNVNTSNFLTICALNIGTYAFYRSCFHRLKSKNIEEMAFITLDMPLFACIDEDIKAVYFEHGLLYRSLLIPKVNHFYTLTNDEEKYIKKLIPDIKISRLYTKNKIKKVKNNIILFLSPNNFLEDFYKIPEFINQSIFNNLQFVIRPTPQATENEISMLIKELPSTILDDTTLSLNESIEKWNPKLIASGWMSTGLATALDYECLPVSLYDPDIKDKWMKQIYPNDYWNTIYPVKSRILFWPRDYQIIKVAITSQSIYEDHIKRLLSEEGL